MTASTDFSSKTLVREEPTITRILSNAGESCKTLGILA